MTVTSRINPQTSTLLNYVTAADAVSINGELFIILKKNELLTSRTISTTDVIEDFIIMFETEFDAFSWYDLTCDSIKLGDNSWQIGQSVVSFLLLQPITESISEASFI